MNGNCAPSYAAASACRVRALHTPLANGPGCRPREDAMARAGAAFSLKDFHAQALSLGAMGLDPLREALARI